MLNRFAALALAAGLIDTGSAHAELHDRGGGLLYDDVLNVTWLQDANYAKTSGYSRTGKMSWADATKWVSTLVYHDPVRNVDHTGWRLPKVEPVSGDTFNHQFRIEGRDRRGLQHRQPPLRVLVHVLCESETERLVDEGRQASADFWRDEKLDRRVEWPGGRGSGEESTNGWVLLRFARKTVSVSCRLGLHHR